MMEKDWKHVGNDGKKIWGKLWDNVGRDGKCMGKIVVFWAVKFPRLSIVINGEMY